MFRRPQYIAFSVILFLALVFVSLPDRTTTRLKLALSSLFLPLFGLANSVQNLTEHAEQSVRSKRSLVAEAEELRRENEKLRLEATQNGQLWDENNQLREALGWQKQTPWHLKLARVVLRDPANWWRTIQIDLGQRDGLRPDLPVLTPDGLVGRVKDVHFNSSQVVLIGDAACQVSAIVEDAPEKGGAARRKTTINSGVIAAGSSSVLDPSIVTLTFLDRQSVVRPGQRVATSGLGPVFPRGIPIGQIVGASGVSSGLYLEARVKLAANLADLKTVWVMLP